MHFETISIIGFGYIGLPLKPDIDDLRESPALVITHRLASEHSGPVWAVEPNVHELPDCSNQRLHLKPLMKL